MPRRFGNAPESLPRQSVAFALGFVLTDFQTFMRLYDLTEEIVKNEKHNTERIFYFSSFLMLSAGFLSCAPPSAASARLFPTKSQSSEAISLVAASAVSLKPP